MAKNLTSFDLNGRLQVVQNDVIGPYQAREERKSKQLGEKVTIYDSTFPFKLKMKQMWKPYGLRELFERVIPSQGHENDGLIFTPVRDGYVAGTCHRLLKWKPSEMNSIDFQIVITGGEGGQLFMASHGKPCYYTDFDPKQDSDLMKTVQDGEIVTLDGKIAEFRLNPAHPNKWTFMRFRPDKRLPNDTKTVEKVLQSIKDNVKSEDLLEREAVMRANWKSREQNCFKSVTTKTAVMNTTSIMDSHSHSSQFPSLRLPRSQTVEPSVPFKYPLNLRTEAAKAAYTEADGWTTLDESEQVKKRVKTE